MLFFVEPDVFTAGAVPPGRYPFLLPVHRVFVTENPDELEVAVRAFPLIFLLVCFPPYGVHQGV